MSRVWLRGLQGNGTVPPIFGGGVDRDRASIGLVDDPTEPVELELVDWRGEEGDPARECRTTTVRILPNGGVTVELATSPAADLDGHVAIVSSSRIDLPGWDDD